MKERLQKILSAAGICSRRAAESYITAGRVKVNGITANLGESADPEVDEILVDGRPLGKKSPRMTYIMLNKPRGYVTTLSDEAGRKTVADLIADVPERVYPVGRLDMHSEGLLLLTNDGQLAHSLMHPSHEVYKEYLVKLSPDEEGLPTPEKPLSGVIELDGERLLPAKCRLLAQTENGYIMTIAIRQGKNRQIRRMCAKCGYTVNSLKRVSEGDVKLGDLPSGRWRYLTEAEVRYLKSL
ncbi:MAG: rRNA pseudouridine synthase [Clostridia bacterium]|nr:rRNA pseudouridine synthase [Clostridia bacterium]